MLARLFLLAAAAKVTSQSTVVVHEWGTFTTVAGVDGASTHWAPPFTPRDLPCFVKRIGPPPFTKAGMALVRMETPVLYFYSDKPAKISVDVSFPRGLFTEWFPSATTVSPSPFVPGAMPFGSMNARLSWRGVEILPGAAEAPPTERRPNHYYAARETAAAPLRVNGEWERLLFYRGLGGFSAPLRVRFDGERRVSIDPESGFQMPAAMLFENRDGRARIRMIEPGGSSQTVEWGSRDSSIAEAAALVEGLLVANGLYPREAAAMLKTWQDSWFEDGARLIYIVPPKLVNEELPLRLDPEPAELRRVFVGRVELVPPGVEIAVRQAVEEDDAEAFARWGRFAFTIMYRDGGAGNWPIGVNVREYLASVHKAASQPCQAE